MSQLDNIKEQFKASFGKMGQQIQESPSYAQAQDRYESLSPAAQKLVLLLGGLLLVFMLLFVPMMSLSDSQNMISTFEEKRNLIRELFRTYREASAAPSIPIPPPLQALQANVNSVITRAELTPEQIVGVNQSAPEGKLIPNNLIAGVLEIRLAKLNLKQIVDIGTSLVGISESVKMKDMLISANSQDTRYFDVSYKLYSLNVPAPVPELPPEPEKPQKRNSGNN
jgi:hypothetical protein